MAYQPQLTTPTKSNRPRSQSGGTTQSPSSTERVRNTLKEYDKDNDGYINWNEFCQMAHDNNYNNSERKQLWIQLGGTTENNKISIQQIIQSSPKKKQKPQQKFSRQKADWVSKYTETPRDDIASISHTHSRKLSNESRASRNSQDESCDDLSSTYYNKNKRSATPKGTQSYNIIPNFNTAAASAKYHSDEEPEERKHRIQRANTSENSLEEEQLMDNPLLLFQHFDLNRNGKLNRQEFKNMLHKIYNSDDIKDSNDNDLFDLEIQKAFNQFDLDKNGNFYYNDNVHDLEEALRPYDNKPNKYELIKLCIQIFGVDNNNNNINYNNNNNNNDDDSKNDLEIEKSKDPIEYVREIMEQFTVNAENKTKQKYQMAKMTVQELCAWINTTAIPAIKDNENLKQECDTLKTNYSSLEHKSKLIYDELDIKKKYTSELDITNKNITNESHYKDDAIRDLKQKHIELQSVYFALQREYETFKKNHSYEELSRGSTREYIIENNRLKEEVSSLKKQLNDMQNMCKEKVTRLQDELHKRVIPAQTYLHTGISSHGGGLCIPNSDSDNYSNDSFDNDESRYHGLQARGNSHDSVRIIHDAHSVVGGKSTDRIRTEPSDSDAAYMGNTLENEFDNEDSKQSSAGYNMVYYEDRIGNDMTIRFDQFTEVIKNEMKLLMNRERGEVKDDDAIGRLMENQTSAIIETVTKSVGAIVENNRNGNGVTDRDLVKRYNEFYAAHEKLIGELNEENIFREKQWKDVIGKLHEQIGILSERLKDKDSELESYKSEWERCFNEIINGVQQNESKNREILDKLKSEMTEMLAYAKCEEDYIKEFKQAKENEINGLKEQLMVSKKGDDILKYIQENVMHKNDCDEVLQGQIKEIMEKIMSMQNMIKEVDLSDIKGELNEQRDVLNSVKEIMGNKEDTNEILKELKGCVNEIKCTQNKIENIEGIQSKLNEQANILKDIQQYMIDEGKKWKDKYKCDEILSGQVKEIMDMVNNNKKKDLDLNDGISEIKEKLNEQQKVLKCVKESVNKSDINEILKEEMKQVIKDIKCGNDKIENICDVMKTNDIKPIQIQLNNQENILKNMEKEMDDNKNSYEEKLKAIEDHDKVCVSEIKSAQNMIQNMNMEAKKLGLENHISEIKLKLNKQEEVLKDVKEGMDKEDMKEMFGKDIKKIGNDLKTCVSVIECTKNEIENVCKVTMGLDIKPIETQLNNQENILKNIEQYMVGNDEKEEDKIGNDILQGQIKDVEKHLKDCVNEIKSTGENVNKLLIDDDIKEIKMRLNQQDNVLKNIKESVLDKNDNEILKEIKQIRSNIQIFMNTKSQLEEHDNAIKQMKQNVRYKSDNNESINECKNNEILQEGIKQIGNDLKQCITDVKFTKDKMENICQVTNGLNGNNTQIQTQLDSIKQNMSNDNKKRDILENKMNDIENSLKICVNIIKSTQNKIENVSKKDNVNEMKLQLTNQQKILEYIKENMINNNKNSDILQNKINEIENGLKKCINIMNTTQNKVEIISQSSLKDNVIQIHSQLKDQPTVLEHIKQNALDINNNNDDTKQMESIESKLNNIKDFMENKFKKIENYINIKSTTSDNNNNINKDMEQMRSDLNKCITIIQSTNNNNHDAKQMESIENKLNNIKNLMENNFTKIENCINIKSTQNTMENVPKKDNIIEMQSELEHIKQNMIDENKNNNILQNKINDIENSLKKCINIMESTQNKMENISKSSLNDDVTKMQSQLQDQQKILEHIKENMMNDNKTSDTLEKKINEIENGLKKCINMMESPQNKMENILSTHNIIEIESQLKEQQTVLEHIKQNILNINNNNDDKKQMESIENNLNNIKNVMETNFTKIEDCINKTTTNNINNMNKEMEQMHTDLNKCITTIQSTNNNNNDTKQMESIENSLNNMKDLMESNFMKIENCINIESKTNNKEMKQLSSDLNKCITTVQSTNNNNDDAKQMESIENNLNNMKHFMESNFKTIDNNINKEMEQLGSDLNKCITTIQSTNNKIQTISDSSIVSNIKSIQTQLNKQENILKKMGKNITNDQNSANMLLQRQMKEMMKLIKSTHNKVENIPKESLNDNIIKIQCKLNEQQMILKDMKQNMTNNNQNNEQIEMIERGFKQIGDCLCIKSQLCVDAIESSEDTIKNAQIKHEVENVDNFSSLGHNIYQIKSQVSDVFNVINDIKHTQFIHINEIQNNGNDEMDNKSVHSISSVYSQDKLSHLTEQMRNLLAERERHSKQKQQLYDEQQEEKKYMTDITDAKQKRTEHNEKNNDLYLIGLLAPEINKLSVKMDNIFEGLFSKATTYFDSKLNDYNNYSKHSKHSPNNSSKLLLNEMKKIFPTEILNIVKQSHQELLCNISQKIKYITQQQLKHVNNNGFNERQDTSIKQYIAYVDENNKMEMNKKWKQIEEKFLSYSNDANKFWVSQSEIMQRNFDNSLDQKCGEINNSIEKIAAMDYNKEEEKEEEYTTREVSASPTPVKQNIITRLDEHKQHIVENIESTNTQIESQLDNHKVHIVSKLDEQKEHIVESIKSNKTPNWVIGSFNCVPTVLAFIFWVILIGYKSFFSDDSSVADDPFDYEYYIK